MRQYTGRQWLLIDAANYSLNPGNNMGTIAYALEPEQFAKLRTISARLNDPRSLTWDQRRDLANLLDLILLDTVALKQGDLT